MLLLLLFLMVQALPCHRGELARQVVFPREIVGQVLWAGWAQSALLRLSGSFERPSLLVMSWTWFDERCSGPAISGWSCVCVQLFQRPCMWATRTLKPSSPGLHR